MIPTMSPYCFGVMIPKIVRELKGLTVRLNMHNLRMRCIFVSDPSHIVQTDNMEISLRPGVGKTLQSFLNTPLFFRVDWQRTEKKRDEQRSGSSYSQKWAIVGDDQGSNAAGSMFTAYPSMTAGADDAQTPGSVPTTIITASNAVTNVATASTTSSPTIASAAATTTTKSDTKSGGLTTGAIVGIVVGCVVGVILISVVAGCFCFRRRRNNGGDGGGSRGVQDIIAEKEAHASILDRDQPDTPYSEQNSQHPLHRGLGPAGRNESGVDLGIGQAISGESVRTESLHTVAAGGNDRDSAVYSSLGGAANSAHGTPVMGSGPFSGGNSSPPTHTRTPSMSVHDRSSAMGSPVPRSSSQLDRSLSPYRDNVGQHDYGQHHHVVDGADLVQQEHSNDSTTVRSPSSVYSSNPLDELQPISPESARDNDGAAGVVGAGSSGAASSKPKGHCRSTTPSGISGQYAHLVEEGMTDDEIRRLEEEERALDEAIEQAGTTGRKR